MALRDDIRTALREVVTTLGETWQYRRLTSGGAASVRTYSAWTDVTAHATARAWVQEWSDDRQAWQRIETQRVRVSDALDQLNTGDQFQDPDGVQWAVRAQPTSGVGSVAYTVERIIPLIADARRGGGV